MNNVTPLLAGKEQHERREPSGLFPGGVAGFASWWLALAVPFLFYGANTLFLFLYTWPFFLALLPVSVFTGMAACTLLRGHLFWSILVTVLAVFGLFWLLFSLLTGW